MIKAPPAIWSLAPAKPRLPASVEPKRLSRKRPRCASWEEFEREGVAAIERVVDRCRRERGYPNNVPPIELVASLRGAPCKVVAYVCATGLGSQGGSPGAPWAQAGIAIAPLAWGAPQEHPRRQLGYGEHGAVAEPGCELPALARDIWGAALAAARMRLERLPEFEALVESCEIERSAAPAAPDQGPRGRL